MCTVVSVGLGLVSVALTNYVNQLPLFSVIVTMLLSYVVILLLAPVVHKNHPISNAHRLKMRRIAQVFGAVECVVIVLLKLINAEMLAPTFMGCFTTAVLAIVGYLGKSAIKVFE